MSAGEEPLEWMLLTSVPPTTLQHAWEHVGWDEPRWVGEDSHPCLQTGCRLQERQGQSADRLMRWLGLLSPLAVRLLQQRDRGRREPGRPANAVLDADVLASVAAQAGQAPACVDAPTFGYALKLYRLARLRHQ